MRHILFILLLGICGSLSARQTPSGNEFSNPKELIESRNFYVELDRAFPVGGHAIDLFSNRATITVTDSIARGFLPFFGRGYSVSYGGDGAIEFNNTMEDVRLIVKDKKKHPLVIFQFNIKGKDDKYQVILTVTGNNSCSVSVSGNRRSSISYSGKIYPAQPETDKH